MIMCARDVRATLWSLCVCALHCVRARVTLCACARYTVCARARYTVCARYTMCVRVTLCACALHYVCVCITVQQRIRLEWRLIYLFNKRFKKTCILPFNFEHPVIISHVLRSAFGVCIYLSCLETELISYAFAPSIGPATSRRQA